MAKLNFNLALKTPKISCVLNPFKEAGKNILKEKKNGQLHCLSPCQLRLDILNCDI